MEHLQGVLNAIQAAIDRFGKCTLTHGEYRLAQNRNPNLKAKNGQAGPNKRRDNWLFIRDSNWCVLPVTGTGEWSKRDAVLIVRFITLLSFRVGNSLFLLRIRARWSLHGCISWVNQKLFKQECLYRKLFYLSFPNRLVNIRKIATIITELLIN